MIDPFPQDWELVGLFEVDPILTDPDLPWAYNSVTFDTERGDEQIHCEILRSIQAVRFCWRQSGKLRLDLDLNLVSGLNVELSAEREVMTIEFCDASQFLCPLKLQIRPHVLVSWGTNPRPD